MYLISETFIMTILSDKQLHLAEVYIFGNFPDPHKEFANRLGLSRQNAKETALKMLFESPFIRNIALDSEEINRNQSQLKTFYSLYGKDIHVAGRITLTGEEEKESIRTSLRSTKMEDLAVALPDDDCINTKSVNDKTS